MRPTRLAALAVAAVLLPGCGSGGEPKASPSPKARPTTPATLRILSPRPGQQVGRDVTVKVSVTGAEVLEPDDVTATSGGHVHLYVDGRLSQMTKDLTVHVTLTPGQHTVRVDFVAPDHAPFANPVSSSVLFTVTA
jgi:hypothetical protein